MRRSFHSSSIVRSFSRQSTNIPPPTAEERRRAAEKLPLQFDERPPFTSPPEPLPSHNISEDAAASLVSKLLGSASSKLDALPTTPNGHSRFKLPTKWSNALVLRPIIRETLKKAYPLLEDLTPIQAKLLAALSKRTHLALADIPGTGKSFALATWLLNIDRSTTTVSGEVEPTTTALVLVPSADLAMQYEFWISNILARSGSEAIEGNIAGFIQSLYRTGTVEGDEKQKKRLEEHPKPHIIVATPKRVLDLLEEGLQSPRKLLDLEHLKLVAVDEADSLLDLEIEWVPPSRNPQQAPQVPKVSPTGSSGRYDNKKEKERAAPPAEQLLDYLFNLRNKKLLTPRRAKGELNYIQLVLASSSKGAKGMRRWIERAKRDWLSPYGSAWAGGMQGAVSEAKGMDMGFAPKYMPVKEGDLVSPIITTLQREGTTCGAVLRKVHQSVKHHILAYDIETGLLRDAPLERKTIERKLREFLKQSSKTGLVGGLRKSKPPSPANTLFFLDEKEKKAIGDDGYPVEITVPILEKLLEHDNWPEQVIVGLATQASKSRFQKACEEIGIKARQLSFQSWNSQNPKVHKLGRSDEYIASSTPPSSTPSKEEGRRRTQVWITDPVSCTGLDCPGITHAYLFHRIESTKDYVAYCGRVSRHPFAVQMDSAAWAAFDISSHEEPGKIKSRTVTPGKVTSIILEEHITPEELEAEREAEKILLAKEKEEGLFLMPGEFGGYKPGKGEKVVRVISGQDERGRGGQDIGLPVVQRGSMFEKDAYLFEGVRREKIGCVVESYFKKEEVGMDARRVERWEDVEDDIEDYAVKLWGPDDPREVQEAEEREVLKTDSRSEALTGKGHEMETLEKDSETESLAEKGHEREVLNVDTKGHETEMLEKDSEVESLAEEGHEMEVLNMDTKGHEMEMLEKDSKVESHAEKGHEREMLQLDLGNEALTGEVLKLDSGNEALTGKVLKMDSKGHEMEMLEKDSEVESLAEKVHEREVLQLDLGNEALTGEVLKMDTKGHEMDMLEKDSEVESLAEKGHEREVLQLESGNEVLTGEGHWMEMLTKDSEVEIFAEKEHEREVLKLDSGNEALTREVLKMDTKGHEMEMLVKDSEVKSLAEKGHDMEVLNMDTKGHETEMLEKDSEVDSLAEKGHESAVLKMDTKGHEMEMLVKDSEVESHAEKGYVREVLKMNKKGHEMEMSEKVFEVESLAETGHESEVLKMDTKGHEMEMLEKVFEVENFAEKEHEREVLKLDSGNEALTGEVLNMDTKGHETEILEKDSEVDSLAEKGHEREVLKLESGNEALTGEGHEMEMLDRDSEDEILAERRHESEVLKMDTKGHEMKLLKKDSEVENLAEKGHEREVLKMDEALTRKGHEVEVLEKDSEDEILDEKGHEREVLKLDSGNETLTGKGHEMEMLTKDSEVENFAENEHEREVLKLDSGIEALTRKGHEMELLEKDSEDEILAGKGHERDVEEDKLGEEGRIVPDELQKPPPADGNAEIETIDATTEPPANSSDILLAQKATELPSNPESATESQPPLQDQPKEEEKNSV